MQIFTPVLYQCVVCLYLSIRALGVNCTWLCFWVSKSDRKAPWHHFHSSGCFQVLWRAVFLTGKTQGTLEKKGGIIVSRGGLRRTKGKKTLKIILRLLSTMCQYSWAESRPEILGEISYTISSMIDSKPAFLALSRHWKSPFRVVCFYLRDECWPLTTSLFLVSVRCAGLAVEIKFNQLCF